MNNLEILKSNESPIENLSVERTQEMIEQMWDKFRNDPESYDKAVGEMKSFQKSQLEKDLDIKHYILYHNLIKSTLPPEDEEVYHLDTPDNRISKFIHQLHAEIMNPEPNQ